MSKTIAEQLSGSIIKNTRDKFKTDVDGINHINIYNEGATELGTLLSLETKLRFVHPVLGPFSHMTGYWTYVKSNSHRNAYRVKDPKTCLFLARRDNDINQQVTNFKAIIVAGLYYKVLASKELKEMLAESTLPFEMYYVKKENEVNPVTGREIIYDVKVKHKYAAWILPGFTEVRNAIREDRKPDYSSFIDHPEIPLYKDFVAYNEKEEEPAPLVNKSIEVGDSAVEVEVTE